MSLPLAAALVLALEVSAQAASPPRLAILPLRVEGLNENEVKRITAIVRARSETRGGFALQSKDTTDSVVDSAQALGIDCVSLDPACAAKLGGVADVDWVLSGAATRLEDRVGVDLRLVEVKSGALKNHASALLPVDPDGQIAAVEALVERFYLPSGPAGVLDVVVTPADAAIAIDGGPRGAGAQTIAGLVPGEHDVAVSKQGFVTEHQRVTVVDGGKTQARFALVEDTRVVVVPGEVEPPTTLELVLPFAIAGTGVAATTAGVIVAVVASAPLRELEVRKEQQRALDENDPSYPQKLADSRKEMVPYADAWNNGGIWIFWGAVAGAGVGLVAAIAGVVWGGTVVARLPDE